MKDVYSWFNTNDIIQTIKRDVLRLLERGREMSRDDAFWEDQIKRGKEMTQEKSSEQFDLSKHTCFCCMERVQSAKKIAELEAENKRLREFLDLIRQNGARSASELAAEALKESNETK
jgi:hypothetical protein